jgi:hypothetical protein
MLRTSDSREIAQHFCEKFPAPIVVGLTDYHIAVARPNGEERFSVSDVMLSAVEREFVAFH